jgi:hypothetical protein
MAAGAPGRPLTRLSTLTLLGHVLFELAAGVGMPLASVLGPVPAALVWTVSAGAVTRGARRAPASADPVFATVNGLGLAAAVAHLVAWPSRRTRTGVPWLTECEGLGPELMPSYNVLIQAGGATAVTASIAENRSAPAWRPLWCLAAVPALVAAQRWEHARLRDRADRRPAWWTRRLRRHPSAGAIAPGWHLV